MLNKILLVFAFLAISSETFAHGTGYRRSELESVPLEFFYSTGEIMSYCEFKIYSPSDDKFAYQSGRTDENGRVSFIPNVSGLWRAVVNDGQGHQCTAEIEINKNNPAKNDQAVEIANIKEKNFTSYEILMRAFFGVSIIFNIFLFFRLRSKNAH